MSPSDGGAFGDGKNLPRQKVLQEGLSHLIPVTPRGPIIPGLGEGRSCGGLSVRQNLPMTAIYGSVTENRAPLFGSAPNGGICGRISGGKADRVHQGWKAAVCPGKTHLCLHENGFEGDRCPCESLSRLPSQLAVQPAGRVHQATHNEAVKEYATDTNIGCSDVVQDVPNYQIRGCSNGNTNLT